MAAGFYADVPDLNLVCDGLLHGQCVHLPAHHHRVRHEWKQLRRLFDFARRQLHQRRLQVRQRTGLRNGSTVRRSHLRL